MRIVHIDETFHPLYGYHTAPLAKAQAQRGHAVTIVTVQEDKLCPVYLYFGDQNRDMTQIDKHYEEETGVKVVRVPVFGYVSSRAIYKSKIFAVIKALNPDIVYAHLVESYISVRLILKDLPYPVLFDSHMLAMASKNPLAKMYEKVYRKCVTARIIRRGYTVIRTQDDAYVNSHLGIPEEQTPFISFGTDTDLFKPDRNARKEFRDKHHISEHDFLVVYTGKLTEDKGGLLLANTVKQRFLIRDDRRIIFVVVGNTVGEYGQVVERTFSESENPIIRFPVQDYCSLPGFYQAADLCVFPKQCSLSFYDAQACGVPVLSEDNNVNVERVSQGNGFVFQNGNQRDFFEKIQACYDMALVEYDTISQNALKFVENGYSYKSIAEQYEIIMHDTIEKHFSHIK